MYLKSLLGVVTAFVLLLIFKQIFYFSCFISLAIPLLVTLIITYSLARMKMLQRACLAECYFVDNSFLSRLVKSPFLPLFMSFLLATFVSLFLVISLVFMGNFELFLLFVDLLLLTFAYHYLLAKLSTSLKEPMAGRVLIAMLTWLNVLLMALVYATMQYYSAPPFDLAYGLEHNILTLSNSVASECGFLNALLKLNAELQVLGWHGWDYLIRTLSEDTLRLFGTLLFLLQGGVLFFALSRYLLEVLYFISGLEKKDG